MTPHYDRLAAAALVALILAGCGDDTTGTTDATTGDDSTASSGNPTGSTSDATGSSSETTAGTGDATSDATSDPTETSDATTETSDATTDPTTETSDATTDPTTETTETTDSTESETETDATTEGIEPFDIPFVPLDPFLAPPPALVTPGWLLITSEAEWTAWTGVAVPPEIDFASEWLILGSLGAAPFPGHALAVKKLTWDAGTITVDADAIAPGPDCETYTFTWPQAALVSIEPLAVAVDGFAEALADQETSCAAGVGDFADCDLETPCVTGLLCAGLIRSTVLTDAPWGLCMDKGNVGVFDGAGAAIPDGGPTLAINLEADGLTTVDTDVVIWVDTDHPAPEELVITLENPSGNVVPVWSKLPGPMHPGGLGIVPTGFSGDESVNGTWTLYVSDTVANGVTGDVLGWRLEIMSRYD